MADKPLVHSGFPSPAEDYLDKPLDLNARLVRNPESTFFLVVQGDEMAHMGVGHGDLLVVDRALEPLPGRLAVAVEHGELVLRLLARDQRPPEIWGVVRHVIRSLADKRPAHVPR